MSVTIYVNGSSDTWYIRDITCQSIINYSILLTLQNSSDSEENLPSPDEEKTKEKPKKSEEFDVKIVSKLLIFCIYV